MAASKLECTSVSSRRIVCCVAAASTTGGVFPPTDDIFCVLSNAPVTTRMSDTSDISTASIASWYRSGTLVDFALGRAPACPSAIVGNPTDIMTGLCSLRGCMSLRLAGATTTSCSRLVCFSST
ncbi:hypothetical protein H310_00192 [Aphanomyces invadans]|uniref:Uncharacterized protein n=1 Tax=Aphanomyces invadans TaxID=157072 RepID=A0A024UVI8_9STRA|nr:hypothetical protein H310_00192 [Aphanomyces invadans]ETW09678.1 hypothetical protein H310_00192 [Aphanomyces invadans]|eukprot:XP_008861089.1 hypothetical protein H310_00192 [Aphanomyces invadans]